MPRTNDLHSVFFNSDSLNIAPPEDDTAEAKSVDILGAYPRSKTVTALCHLSDDHEISSTTQLLVCRREFQFARIHSHII